MNIDIAGALTSAPWLLVLIGLVAIVAVLTGKEIMETSKDVGANQGDLLFEQNLEAIASGASVEDMLIQQELSPLEKKIADAGMKMTPQQFKFMQYALPFIIFAVLAILASPLAGAAGAVGYAYFFHSTVKGRTQKRIELMERQLCQAEMQIAENSKSGLSIERSIAVCCKQADEPLKSQLIRVHNEISYTDLNLAQAFENMAKRTNSGDVHILASVISVQQETGSNFAETLYFLADTIGKKMEMRRTLKSRVSEMKMTKYVVAGTPILVFLMCSFIMQGFTEFYTTNPIGWVVLGICVGLELIGLKILGKLEAVKID